MTVKKNNAPGFFIQEEDGSPAKRFRRLKVSNGTLTDNGDGSGSLTTGGGAVGAPNTASFITIANDATLTAERALAGGSSISLVDGGANNSLTINFDGGITPSGDLGGTWVTPTVVDLSITNESAGDLIKFDGTNWVKVPPGSAGSVLAVATGGTDLTYIAAAGGAPSNATYIVQALDGTLTDERVLTGGSSISLVDGGAGSTMTVNFDGGATPSGDLGGTWVTPTVTDLTIASEAQGDMLIRGASSWSRLPIGTAGSFMAVKDGALTPLWTTAPAGGSGTWFKHLPIQSIKLTGDDIASSSAIDAGDRGWRVLLDDTNTESGLWQFVVDPNYSGGTVTAEILFSMTSAQANSSSVAIAGRFMATTGSSLAIGDKVDWNTSGYAATQTSTHVLGKGYTAGYVQKSFISFTNALTSSMAVDDMVRFHIQRTNPLANNASGDMELLGVVLHE